MDRNKQALWGATLLHLLGVGWLALVWIDTAYSQSPAKEITPKQELIPLPYNNPGLVVDLGVGLWAWPIPCDADGDGDFDLLVSCPDKPSNGIWFFENKSPRTPKSNSKTTLNESGNEVPATDTMPIFEPARRISSTVHYVMPSYIGETMRVLSPGKEYLDFAQTGTSQSTTLSVPANFYKPRGGQTKGPKVRHNQWRLVDYDGDGTLDLIVGVEDWSFYGWDDAWNDQGIWQTGPLRGFVFCLKGLSDGSFSEPQELKTASDSPIETFGCPSPNFFDGDGDGDLDLLCGEFLDGFTYFENVGSRTVPKYRDGLRVMSSRQAPLVMDLQMIVPIAFDWDRDGNQDLIVGDEDGRVAFVRNTGRLDERRVPVFETPRYFQQVADTLKCGALATPVGVDWDDDGDEDIVSGNTSGTIEFFENLSGPGIDPPKWAAPKRLQVDGKEFRVIAGSNGSIQGPAEAKWGYTTFSVADWDHDGLKDIVLNSILGKVIWLRNIGQPGRPILAPPQPIEVDWDGQSPRLAWGWLKPNQHELLTQWRTTPVVSDFNADGLNDLAMLDTEGYLAFFERVKKNETLSLRAPKRLFVDAQGVPLRLNSKSAGGSGRRKLAVCDWNGDGKLDWLLNNKNAEVLLQIPIAMEGTNQAWAFRSAGSVADRNIEGHDVSPTTIDLDGDGVRDFLGGAEDGRMYYLNRK